MVSSPRTIRKFSDEIPKRERLNSPSGGSPRLSQQSATLLLIAADETAGQLAPRLAARGHQVLHSRPAEDWPGELNLDEVSAALFAWSETHAAFAPPRMGSVISSLAERHIPSILWGPTADVEAAAATTAQWLSPATSLDEVIGHLCEAARLRPVLSSLVQELDRIERISGQLQRYFKLLDEEMALAARMQRDLIPRDAGELPIRLSCIYRPATWVSGDMFDFFPIRDDMVGLFIADAMGHGIAAGLMTMFLRQVLTEHCKRDLPLFEHDPAAVLVHLHDAVIRMQQDSRPNFVTAVLGTLEPSSGKLRMVRAGHPFPLIVRACGSLEAIAPGGSLLGVPEQQPDFDVADLTLGPKDVLVLYTDGAQDIGLIPTISTLGAGELHAPPPDWVGKDACELADAIEAQLDSLAGSLHPADDVTIAALAR
jgi:sigma-B regulation protein RsbU (phosphoserine phosphatase)